MTNILPTFNANPNAAMVAGYSSGSFMSSQLSLVFPEMFKAAAFLNGGMPGGTPESFEEIKAVESLPDDDKVKVKTLENTYQIQKEKLDQLYAEQNFDQNLMAKEFSGFFHAGEQDPEVPQSQTDMNLRYFKERGVVGTRLVKSPNFGHWFPDLIPFEANSYMLQQISQVDPSLKDYRFAKAPDSEWRKNGVYGKFD